MILKIKRTHFQDKCTIGHLYIDGIDAGIFTLEDKVRYQKVFGETAIPAGRYRVILDFSKHFQRVLPRVCEVPGFEGVRIHSGNTDTDTEGCILVGKEWSHGDFIGKSHEAFEELLSKLQVVQEIELEIS